MLPPQGQFGGRKSCISESEIPWPTQDRFRRTYCQYSHFTIGLSAQNSIVGTPRLSTFTVRLKVTSTLIACLKKRREKGCTAGERGCSSQMVCIHTSI